MSRCVLLRLVVAIALIAIVANSPLTAAASRMDFGGALRLSTSASESSGTDVTSTSYGLQISGQGFIWQPWFATTGLLLNLDQVESEADAPAGSSSSRTSSSIVTGEGRIRLFPVSRFPFQASVRAFDARVENDASGIGLSDVDTTRSTEYNLRQEYSPLQSSSRYSGAFRRLDRTDSDGGRRIFDAVELGGNNSFARHRLSYQVRSESQESADIAADSDQTDALFASHQFSPSASWSVSSDLGVTQREVVTSFVRSATDEIRVGSTVDWSPRDSKWSGSATGNLFEREREAGGQQFSEQGGLFAGRVAYRASRNLRYSGSAGLSRSEQNAVRTDTQFQTAAATYSADVRNIGDYRYVWSVDGSLANFKETNEEAVRTVALGGQHSLSREGVLGAVLPRRYSLALRQSLRGSDSSDDTDLYTLTHIVSYALAWESSATSNTVRVDVTDTRSRRTERQLAGFDEEDSSIQSILASGSILFSLGPYRSLATGGSIGLTWVDDDGAETTARTGALRATYTDRRLFQVRRLELASRLEVGFVERSSIAAVDDEGDRALWDTRLSYRVGLLETRAQFTLTSSGSNTTMRYLLSATRRF